MNRKHIGYYFDVFCLVFYVNSSIFPKYVGMKGKYVYITLTYEKSFSVILNLVVTFTVVIFGQF